MTTMLSLVGGQPMPNLIAALQYQPETVVGFATPQTKNEFEGIKEVLHARGIKTDLCVVNPYDMREIETAIGHRIEASPGASCVANITGATKMMALTLYRYANARKIPIIYVVSELGKIYEYRGDDVSEQTVAVTLTVREYIAAHNFKMTVTPSATYNATTARVLANHAGESFRFLKTLRTVIQRAESSSKEAVEVRLPPATGRAQNVLVDELIRREIVVPLSGEEGGRLKLNRRYRRFLGGEWLEVYVWHTLSTSGTIDDCLRNVVVEDAQRTRNEIDVVVAKNAKVGVLSCKTGHVERHWIDDIAERGRSLGRYSRRFIVCNAPVIPPAFATRAASQNIRVIGGRDLPRLAEIVSREMERNDAELD